MGRGRGLLRALGESVLKPRAKVADAWGTALAIVLILRTQKRHHLSSCGDPASVFSPEAASSAIGIVVVVVVVHKGR